MSAPVPSVSAVEEVSSAVSEVSLPVSLVSSAVLLVAEVSLAVEAVLLVVSPPHAAIDKTKARTSITAVSLRHLFITCILLEMG